MRAQGDGVSMNDGVRWPTQFYGSCWVAGRLTDIRLQPIIKGVSTIMLRRLLARERFTPQSLTTNPIAFEISEGHKLYDSDLGPWIIDTNAQHTLWGPSGDS